MRKARKKPQTAAEETRRLPDCVNGRRVYAFAVSHEHAGTRYAVGDRVALTEAEVARIRLYAGAEALTDDEP